MVKHKLVSFVAVVALCTHEILLIKLIRINSSSEIHTRQKLCHFGRYVAKAKIFCLKSFCFAYPGWSVHMGKFPSRLPRDPGPGFSHEHIEIFTN